MGRKPAFARSFLEAALSSTTDLCIVWPYSLTSTGYPQITIAGKIKKVCRYVCEQVHGPAPSDQRYVAAHAPQECHNPKCINPKHLRWATYSQNEADKHLDGTVTEYYSSLSKLEVADVYAIRNSTESTKVLARRYCVSIVTVQRIKSRKRWAWLPEKE